MRPEDGVRVALVGYGLAGRMFHRPLIAATSGMHIAAVVTADPTRAAQARVELPGVSVMATVHELVRERDRFDLVVVASTTGSHVAVAEAVVDAGLPLVVEKPLAPTAAEARAVADRARRRGVSVAVFHNRRWDAEYLTLRRLVRFGELGEVLRCESRIERWRPHPDPSAWRHREPAQRGGGVLLDLGVHLVDQALDLFGPARAVYAEVECRRGGADDDVFVAVDHASGVRSHLWAGLLCASPGPRLRVLGRRGAFVVDEIDGQEDQLRAGQWPDDADFGEVPVERWGRLVEGDGDGRRARPVRSERGRWLAFYEQVAAMVRHGAPPPVSADDACVALEVLDAARRSAATATVVRL